MKEGDKDSLKSCKAFCLEERRCTAINYDEAIGDCELRDCTFPIAPPDEGVLFSSTSHWIVATGS